MSDSSTAQPDIVAFVRDGEIWLADGNVVLEAQGHAFKVYQGLLAHNSEVFRDLFSLPQPTSPDAYDGCPIVHLTDHPDELRHLLHALFFAQSRHGDDERLDFSIVASLIRLSHKYQIDHIRNAYLSRMRSCFPTSLETWDAVNRDLGSPVMEFCRKDAITAVNVARLTETDSMLPSALLTCCLMETECILNGVRRIDGTLDRLSPANIIMCLDARQTLLHKAFSTRMEILLPLAASPQCNFDQCRRMLQTVQMMHLHTRPKHLVRDVFSSSEGLISLVQTHEGVCAVCADTWYKAEEQARRQLWIDLPRILGIGVPAGWPRELPM
ncbi:uncharacterized protein B0H18DRAFT_1019051 [Fomitopsis serialis]|uniref:uncharacterized protein n=1 Tax=Fomitopsis serialis TaxID=139415 RepID=UPI0020076E4A|nr:uncharacterized protein B0H18DRAFT_1019051 [Neoantrodia serialis]KAH9922083.1 hypothetical protein B0H18DRAFT_1019051 [Neoantrodia serialis]